MLFWLPLTVLAAFVVYQLATIIYNIWFHPLSEFKGPKLWVAFPVLRYVYACLGTLDKQILKFHQQYGEVVRYTDNALSFTTAQAWKDIYGYGHGSKQWAKREFRPPGATSNILFSDDEDHAKFRRALAHSFSEQSLRLQEDLIRGYVDTLITNLQEEAAQNKNVDMTMWYNLTTFDIISDLAFGVPSGCPKNRAYTEYITTMFKFVRIVPFVALARFYPSIWRIISIVIGKDVHDKREALFKIGQDTAMKRKEDRSKDGRGDFMEALLKHSEQKAPISDAELGSNAHILFLAGSETTATLLAGVTYYMLKTPEAYQKAVSEVRSAFTKEADISFTSASLKLPYMLARIEEGLRMYPPVPTLLLRVTPENGPSTVDGHTVPPGINVGVHQLSTHYSPQNFHEPGSFVPERWLPSAVDDHNSPFHNDNRDARQPFSVGPRNCIGKNLAFSEMRQILARILWNFDRELVDKQQDWADQKIYSLWAKGELQCRISMRQDLDRA